MPCVGRTKVDGLLLLVDEESVICHISVVETSGPAFVIDNNHFMKDHIKIAKNLKYFLNKIRHLNCQGRNNIKKIKQLCSLQVYQKKV